MKSLTQLFVSLMLSLLLAGAAFAGETVNINTADAATLDRVLVNIGPAKAQAIVDYRKTHGAFRSAEQLAMVKGIGLKTAQRVILDLKDKIVSTGIADELHVAKEHSAGPSVNTAVKGEAVSALTMLGFSPAPSAKVVVEILTAQQVPVKLCKTCADARGVSRLPLADGVAIGTLVELAQWTLAAEKVLTF